MENEKYFKGIFLIILDYEYGLNDIVFDFKAIYKILLLNI